MKSNSLVRIGGHFKITIKQLVKTTTNLFLSKEPFQSNPYFLFTVTMQMMEINDDTKTTLCLPNCVP